MWNKNCSTSHWSVLLNISPENCVFLLGFSVWYISHGYWFKASAADADHVITGFKDLHSTSDLQQELNCFMDNLVQPNGGAL